MARSCTLNGAERAIIRSRVKLAYATEPEAELPPGCAEVSRRIEAAEAKRGAARVDPPEQEVAALGDGQYELAFRPRLVSESRNAALSLAANLAVADALFAHKTGLFRVMPDPDARAVQRLRMTAKALDLHWPVATPLTDYERSLDPANPAHAALMLAIRGRGRARPIAVRSR